MPPVAGTKKIQNFDKTFLSKALLVESKSAFVARSLSYIT
jgi:hypothetical protein